MERFSELIKKNLQTKLVTFVYFTKNIAVIWSINKIIPVSVALIQNEKGFDVEKNLEKITSMVSVMESTITDIENKKYQKSE